MQAKHFRPGPWQVECTSGQLGRQSVPSFLSGKAAKLLTKGFVVDDALGDGHHACIGPKQHDGTHINGHRGELLYHCRQVDRHA